MTNDPETRASLLMRLHDPADQAAWSEFVEIYRPLITRLARWKGLQHCDAEDLAQQVLVSVAGAISQWRPDPARARFRTWLNAIARNAILNALARRPLDAPGAHDVHGDLANQPELRKDSEMLDLEHRREVFRWAAGRIRPEFQDETWQAFWRTAVAGESIEQVAADLGKQRGSVYAARSRVMRRLQEQVRLYHEE